MTKILNFALKIKGGGREGGTCEVLRSCHAPKIGTCTSAFRDNPIQAGLFWNYIGCAPLCFSSICCLITTKLGMLVLWHKISQKQ